MATKGRVLIQKLRPTVGRWTSTAPTGNPASSEPRDSESRLEVVVLHTTTKGTLAALRTAGTLAKGLAARIRVLVVEVVPYPLPVTAPPVPVDFTQRHFRTLVGDYAIDTEVDIRLCRDRQQLLESALAPSSVVVMGGKRSVWPTKESRIAKSLERLGHQVVFSSPN